MAKIQFNIKFRPQIESGEYKVIVRDNTPAHILSFEALGPYPICYQVGDGMDADFPPRPEVYFANEKGECSYVPCSLFLITPEEEMTEWEMAIGRTLTEAQRIPRDKDGIASIHDIAEFIKKKAAEFLAIARMELEPEILERLEEAYKNQDDVVYENGKRDGKAEALKDLPRWKPAAVTYDGDRLPKIDWLSKRLVAKFKEGIFYLDMNELYKLPGFKED